MSHFVLGKARYEVTAPLVIAQRLTGSLEHVYADGFLPVDTSRLQIADLLASGQIREIQDGA